MNDVKRVWTAEEIREWAFNDCPQGTAIAAYLARCTRLMRQAIVDRTRLKAPTPTRGTLERLRQNEDIYLLGMSDALGELLEAIDEEGDK